MTQAAAITRYVVAQRQHWRADPAAVAAPLSAALQAAPLVVCAIAEHSARAAATGAWLATGHEGDHESAYPWRALTAEDPTPRLVAGLETIATRATTALVRATTATYQPAKPAREVLADVNTLATRTEHRDALARAGPGPLNTATTGHQALPGRVYSVSTPST